jgi:hypothetical protein
MLTTLATILALLLGGLLLVAALALALHPGARASRFGWAVVAGLALSVLGMAAALRPGGAAFPAALMQLAAIVLACALGAASGATPGAPGSSSALGRWGRGMAWLTLIGLPPTYGFHARVALLSAYLGTGWGWLLALGLVATGLLIVAAVREARAPLAGSPRGARALAVVVLIVLIAFLGLYPYLATAGPGAPPSP